MMERIGYDYWADNVMSGKPATLGFLEEKLKNENLDYIKERETREGEYLLKYFYGNIVIRGRTKEGAAYRLSIQPKGFFRKTYDGNNKTLKNIIESQGIKLTKCKEK